MGSQVIKLLEVLVLLVLVLLVLALVLLLLLVLRWQLPGQRRHPA
jgi:hypothetical protein